MTEPRLPPGAGVIYFIEAGDGPIKIGFTSGSATNRMAALQTGNPSVLRLRAAIRGTVADERRWHRQLDASRLNGEWFEPDATTTALRTAGIDGRIDEPERCHHDSRPSAELEEELELAVLEEPLIEEGDVVPAPRIGSLPPHIAAAVQRILDGAARRILDEQVARQRA